MIWERIQRYGVLRFIMLIAGWGMALLMLLALLALAGGFIAFSSLL